jgi:hypothetical protein
MVAAPAVEAPRRATRSVRSNSASFVFMRKSDFGTSAPAFVG